MNGASAGKIPCYISARAVSMERCAVVGLPITGKLALRSAVISASPGDSCSLYRHGCCGNRRVMEQKRLDLGFDHYLWAIVSVGSSELPWISTPACLLKEIKNKTLIQFPDDSYAFLCEHIQTLYMAHEPNTDTSRIDVKRIPSSFSNRVQLFDSVLGSRGNQSEPASFILVKFACETTTGTEHAAQVTKYYKIRVVLHKNGMEETKTCLFAHVRWFKEYSYQMDTIGVYIRKYENAFHEEGAYDPWVPLHQISAQFIPFVFEKPRPDGDPLPPKKVMLPCRVDLKTPC